MKTKLTELAVELDYDFNKLLKLKNEKLEPHEVTGTGKNTWVTPEGRAKLEVAVLAPPAVPNVLEGCVITTAPNRKWVYCKIEGIEGKHPVMISNKMVAERYIGKKIPIHAITDKTGTTYRHASLTSAYS